MKVFTKPLLKAARDSMVGSVIGVASLSLSVLLIYMVLLLAGYEYKVDFYIPQIVVVATIISAVGTTANAYRERKLKRKEQIQKIITENRSKWLAETRAVMADLYATEKTFISNPSENKEIIKKIDEKVSQLVLRLPYKSDEFCDKVYSLANDVKAISDGMEQESISHMLERIREQERDCRRILKNIWDEIKREAKEETED